MPSSIPTTHPVTMSAEDDWRVLPPAPYENIEAYVAAGGGAGLRAARAVSAEVLLGELEASGLRGRGGAGFPTAAKWRTILGFASGVLSTPVVINAAEGEPGTYKDRSILLANPYAVIEGGLIAAQVVGARSLTIATKERFTDVVTRLREAIAEVHAAGWSDDVEIAIVMGPSEYLFGEETALLEVLDGRPPFPRIAPPWRRGSVEVVRDRGDVTSGSGLAADVVLATEQSDATDAIAPPVLVNNVETMANVPGIIAKGAAWFRTLGTVESPGTVVCTVTGAVRHPLVIEVPMGVTLQSVLDRARGHGEGDDAAPTTAVLMGVSSPILLAHELNIPITYEAMSNRGSSLGSAGFIVVDQRTDVVALAAGVARFLAIESCGQCTPCKQDGLEIASLLRTIGADGGTEDDLARVEDRLVSVTIGARCNLALQQQHVIGSILHSFPTEVAVHLGPAHSPVEPVLVSELVRLDGDTATLDEEILRKRPDWTLDTVGNDASTSASTLDRTPVERFTDHRADGA